MNDFYQQISKEGTFDLLLFASAVNASSNGVVITDHAQPDEPIIYCNPAFEKLSGYSHDEIIGHNCRFLQGEDRGQSGRESLRNAIQKGEHSQVELRNYKKDGRRIWNELMISPVKDIDGNITHFIGIQNDITRRKEAELALANEKEYLEQRVRQRTQELQESEVYLSSIIETIRESLIVLDENLKVSSVNEHFCRFFKVTDKEVLGKKLLELGNDSWNIPELANLLKNILPNNNPFENFELETEFPAIGRKFLMLNARQIVSKGKYQNRILLAIEDYTERRATEQRKEDFIKIASHEMRTPLTTIKGGLQLLSRKARKNAHDDYSATLKSAERSMIRLEKLVNNLLDVSKIQSGQLEFNITKFNFNQLIEDVTEHFKIIETTHILNISGGADVEIEADYNRLEQVISNLLTNAIKFSPDAHSVSIHTSVLANHIKVSITDTGVGIHRRDHKKIFERFYRADQILEKFPGVGVGLYVCNQIIKEHKGTLWVESEEGKGSAFSFTVPTNIVKNGL